MILLNALVNSVSDLEERMSFRERLAKRLGLGPVVEQLSKATAGKAHYAELNKQLHIFESEALKDRRTVSRAGLDSGDPDALYAYLKQTTLEDGLSATFLDHLQLLVAIPSDQAYAPLLVAFLPLMPPPSAQTPDLGHA